MCRIGSTVPQSRFFHWFNENVTYPIVVHIRKKYNPLSTSDAEEDKIDLEQQVTMWGYSDISHLEQMTSSERIAKILARGIFLRNWG